MHNLDLNVGGDIFKPFETETEKKLKHTMMKKILAIKLEKILIANVISVPYFIVFMNTQYLKLEKLFNRKQKQI